MKIALHAREVYTSSKHKPGGIARVNRSIVENLPLKMSEDDFEVFLRADSRPRLANNTVRRPSFQRLLSRDALGASMESVLSNCDISYSLATEVPGRAKGLRVGIFHDAVPITHPELLSKPQDAYSHQNSEARRLFDSLKSVDLLHCGSEYARNEAADLLGIGLERSFVAHHGLDLPPAPEIVPAEPRYLLTISRLDPRKNLVRLIQAFDMAALEDVRLVIVGQDGWGVETIREAASKADCREQIEFRGHVLDEEIPRLYAEASWYICPSIMEGFGLPVMEAMHYRCPVLCTNAGAVPEVGGEAALYFDPLNVEEMAHQIRTAFFADRSKFSELSFQQSQKFSPQSMCFSIATNLEKLRR